MEAVIKILKNVADLEQVRQEWNRWSGNRDSEMESYLGFLRSSDVTERPHVIVVEREGKPDAILVGRIDRGNIRCRLGYLRLDLKARILCFVYGAFRGDQSKENSALLVHSVMASLEAGEADAAYMNFLPEDSELFRLSSEQPSLLCRDYVPTTQQHFAATLPRSVDEFYKGLSSSARWQAKSKQKKLIKDFAGDVRIGCYRDVSDLNNLVRDVEQVASRSYQRGLGVGFADTQAMRDGLRLKAERGWLRAYVLYLANRPSAFWIGDINESTFGSDFLAYDAEYGKYSPGMYLILKVIEGFCDGDRENITAIDFATGHAQYKEVLSNQEWHETCVYIFGPTFKGVSLNLVRSLVGGTDKAVKQALRQTGLLQKIKKRWRARVTAKEANKDISPAT